MNFALKPFFETFIVDRSHSSCTCAGWNEGVFNLIFIIETYSAHDLVLISLRIVFFKNLNRFYFLLIWLKIIILIHLGFVCEECVVSFMKRSSWCMVRNDGMAKFTLRGFKIFILSILIRYDLIYFKSDSPEFHNVWRVKQVTFPWVYFPWKDFICDMLEYKPNLFLRIFDGVIFIKISNVWKPVFPSFESYSKKRRIEFSLSNFPRKLDENFVFLLWNKAWIKRNYSLNL